MTANQKQRLFIKGISTVYYLFIDGKDGSDGDETVNVGRAVQRVKAHYVFALEDKEECHE